MHPTSSEGPLIQTVGLEKFFKVPKGTLKAVDGVDLSIMRGQTLGVVGESGCGKSTLGRTLLSILKPTGGKVLFHGQPIDTLGKAELRQFHRHAQIIFQDPYSSINPRMTVSETIMDPVIVSGAIKNRAEREAWVEKLMKIVGLSQRAYNAYPHELDGGRLQRVGIARALALNPDFIVCDEPVSALDVSIQAQILNLLMDLQDDMGLTYLFITHDLSVVKHISNDIMVMYLGKCVEYAPAKTLFDAPQHPYTKALLDAIPEPDLSVRDKYSNLLRGELTSPINPVPGCRFAARCDSAMSQCNGEDIRNIALGGGHSVMCRLFYGQGN